MIMGVTLIVTTGGVILLRPLSRRLGELLQVMTQQKLGPPQQRELEQMRALLAAMESRMARLEKRQGFTEALMESKEPAASLPEAKRAG
jgi:predicted phosphoribosyltransferase